MRGVRRRLRAVNVLAKKTAMTMARLLSSPVLPFAPYFL